MMVLGDPSSMRLGIGGSEVRAACKQCFRLPFRHGSLGECTTQDDRSHGMWNQYVKCLERRVWSRRSLASSPVPAAAGQILAPKKAKKHTKTPHKIKIKSKLNQK